MQFFKKFHLKSTITVILIISGLQLLQASNYPDNEDAKPLKRAKISETNLPIVIPLDVIKKHLLPHLEISALINISQSCRSIFSYMTGIDIKDLLQATRDINLYQQLRPLVSAPILKWCNIMLDENYLQAQSINSPYNTMAHLSFVIRYQRLCYIYNLHSSELHLLEKTKISDFEFGGHTVDLSSLGHIFRSTMIKCISLSSINIDKDDFDNLLSQLENHSYLTSLSLYDVSYSRPCGQPLGLLLQDNSKITNILLHNNNLIDQDIDYIYQGLAGNVTLKTLGLPYNNLQYESLRYLSNLFEKNSTITSLDISGNQLDYNSSLIIAKILTINKSLISLDISDSQLNDNGFASIIKAMENNSTLISLNIESNSGITDQSGPSLVEMLGTNRHLHMFEITDTMLTAHYQNFIKDLLLQNE